MNAATPGQAPDDGLAEIEPGKLDMLADWFDMLADWFDMDDARKGRTGTPEVQADLRRWAQVIREEQLWRLSPDAAAPGPCPGCESLRRQHAETCGEVGMLAGILTEIRDGDHPYGSYARDRARTGLDRLHGAASEPQPAPELAAAMRATKALRDLLDDFTHAVIDLDDGARLVSISRLAAAARGTRTKAGLPPVEGK